jgi:hypothetical protein
MTAKPMINTFLPPSLTQTETLNEYMISCLSRVFGIVYNILLYLLHYNTLHPV